MFRVQLRLGTIVTLSYRVVRFSLAAASNLHIGRKKADRYTDSCIVGTWDRVVKNLRKLVVELMK